MASFQLVESTYTLAFIAPKYNSTLLSALEFRIVMAALAARPLMKDIEPTNSEGPSSSQDPEQKIPTTPDSKRTKKLPKWRRTLVFWLTGSVIVFVAQLSFTLWAYLRAPNDDLTMYYNRNLYEGRCSVAKSINTGAHLLINILSTLLLSGGNYCMQCE